MSTLLTALSRAVTDLRSRHLGARSAAMLSRLSDHELQDLGYDRGMLRDLRTGV